MKRFGAWMLAAALVACAPEQGGEKAGEQPAAEAPDPLTLNIEIGRYGVMLSHVHQLSGGRPGSGEPDPAEPRALARALRETVWEYNIERSRLCARGLFREVTCGPVYDPVWISEPPEADPSLQELQTRSEAVGAEVMGLWNAVCEDARMREPDEQARQYICAIE